MNSKKLISEKLVYMFRIDTTPLEERQQTIPHSIIIDPSVKIISYYNECYVNFLKQKLHHDSHKHNI